MDEAFVRTGTAHLLSVSGIHVGLLALFGWWLGRLIGLRHLAAAVVVLVLVAAYMVLAEPRPPILRAGVLAVLACAAAAMRRPTDTANWLGAGAIVILAVRPTDLSCGGFSAFVRRDAGGDLSGAAGSLGVVRQCLRVGAIGSYAAG